MPSLIPNWGLAPSQLPDPTGALGAMFGGISNWGMADAGALSVPSSSFDSLVSVKPTTNVGGLGAGTPLGFNIGTAQLGLSGLSTLGNLWAAFQAQKLAKQQFNYTKNVTDTNLANQIKTYNTQLTDRASNRSIVEGSSFDKQGYIDANSLKRYGTGG